MNIAELESEFDVHVVTQNIDDLHERAGSSKVLHLHGNIRYAKSSGPNQESEYYPIEGWELTADHLCPEGYRLRPHVVWFGEAVPAYDEATGILAAADCLIVVGTSLQVFPAAGLINYARNARQKYIVDPKANQLNVPEDYIRITGSASYGINQVSAAIKKAL